MEEILYDDFSKLDLRVAKIESSEKIAGKTRILKGIISMGNETRDVIIGGADFYDPSLTIDFIGEFHWGEPQVFPHAYRHGFRFQDDEGKFFLFFFSLFKMGSKKYKKCNLHENTLKINKMLHR